jgi:hypothetical protein
MRRAAVLAILLGACAPEIPGGVYVCEGDADCPEGFACLADDRCWPFEGCAPSDCQALRANCGLIDDGCGTDIDCGECSGTQVCGGGGIPNICACQPAECVPGFSCGTIPDGCGGTVDCGECFGGFACTVEGFCSCSPPDCTGLCGIVADGCGGLADCGGCPTETPNCGGDGVPNVCGTGTCVAVTCETGQCGPIPTGCGDFIECGECADPTQTCGASAPNECGCIALTCAQLGFDCGTVEDPCTGVSMPCGECPTGTSCGGGGRPNVCGCPPRSCDGRCGIIEDVCSGGMVSDCGACPSDAQTCGPDNVCRCAPDAAEDNDTIAATSAQGKLANGDTQVYAGFGIDAVRDADWYGWNVDPVFLSNQYTVRFVLNGVPEGADYDVELRAICLALTQSVTCTPPAEPLERNLGCRSSTAGNADEVIEMVVTGCNVNGVIAGVHPVVFGATCENYGMEISLDVTSIGSDTTR